MSLSPRDRRALKNYKARLDPGATACRIQRRHWFPDISQYGEPDVSIDIKPHPQQRGIYEVVGHCVRCGAEQIYGTARGTGVIEISTRTKLPAGYAFTEEDGGDGRPMDSEHRAFLRKLAQDEALSARSSVRFLRAVPGGTQ